MNIWAIGLFGILGALLRYLTGLWVHDWWAPDFPLGTLMINLTGCLILGWFSAWAASKPGLPAWIRLGFGTGFVGSFTTFSTFSMETVSLVQANMAGLALLYVLSSLVGGFVFVWLGYELFRLRQRRETRGVQPS